MPKLGHSHLIAASLLLLALSMPLAVGATKSAAFRPTQYTAGLTAIDLSISAGSGVGAVSLPLVIGGDGALVPSFTPGSTVTLQFTAVYLAGTNMTNDPVGLFPESASFGFSTEGSTSMFKTLINQTVTPTGQFGTYKYSFQVTPDFPSGGTVVMWILAGSLHDAQNNWGPPIDVSSDLTRLELGTPESWLGKYGVPLLIAAILMLALLLLLARGRKRKKK